MSIFSCCLWWFLLGALVGWLLNFLLSLWLRKTQTTQQLAQPTTTATTAAPSIDIAAAALAGFNLKSFDDLIIIEGIGPKISALLKNNGIHSFSQLAQLSVTQITAILAQGGPRFKLANPSSWAEQAKLASDNRWAELKALQDHLHAGVDLDKNNDQKNADRDHA